MIGRTLATPTAATATWSPPDPGDTVRHVTSRHVGQLAGYAGDAYSDGWALVRWTPPKRGRPGGPGMVDDRGLARVAPRLLERVRLPGVAR